MEKKLEWESVDTQQRHEQEHEHTHQLADGTIIRHTHGHKHSHTQTKAVLNRMSRLIGHLEAIKRMVEDGRDCSEVLVQLSAVRSAINGVSKIILKDHLEHCVVDAVRDNDKEALEQLNKAIDQFMK
ncbi:DNA-binding transcriptional regulator, FrmR family [Selenomonas sp. WCT3]|uniref:metal-sensing transcriptional repressor n=1 Tax=unclassified Selenomonas TaxID=2637378 RepID=UPI0008915CDD|nr:metal-sensing transcriptional repressor [Selenomonas sp.]MCR5438347.1 metal-sensing transcriptional repressor [Selenomonas sp.]SDG73348.1 DNA-binding transcriptional regulator, FrmR family [Selenomonas ruminantium]